MVRGLVWTFVAFCIFISLIVGTVIWLLYSSVGADFVLTRLSRLLDDRLEISRVEGSFARGLSVEGLTFTEEDVSLTAARIDVVAVISAIYPLELNFSAIEIQDLVVVVPAGESDDEQQLSFAIPLPQLPAWFDLVQITLADLSLNKLSLQQGDEVTVVDDVHISGRFSKRKLSLDAFRLYFDGVSVVATLGLDLTDPALNISTTLTHQRPEEIWERIEVDLHLHETQQNALAGTIGIQGVITDFYPFSLHTNVHMSDQMLQFDNFVLRQSQRDGSIQASGRLRLNANGPVLDTRVHFHDLDLSSEAEIPLWLSGLVDLSYGGSTYQGRLDLKSTGHELAAASLSAYFSGDHDQIVFEQMRALWFAAQLDGRLHLDWATTPELVADVDISDLSLDPFVPDSSSLINARLHATYLHLDDSPRATAVVELIDSSFHDYPLSGSIDAVYEDNNLILNRLTLHSHSARLQAQGDLLTRLDFSLTLDRLTDFYPQAEASLTTQGWLRRTDDFVAADVHFDVHQLIYDQWRLASLSGHLALDAEQNLTATAVAENLGSDALELAIDQIKLTTAGRLSDHRVNLRVESQDADLIASIRGNWAEPAWNAVLEDFNLSVMETNWQLRDPTQVVVSPEIIRVFPVVLDGDVIRSLRLHGEYLPLQDSFEVDVSWSDLALTWLEKWAGPLPVHGHLDGQVSLLHQPDQTNIHVSVLSVTDLNYQKLFLEDTETRLTLHWGPDGLDGNLRVDIGMPAHLVLQVQSPQAAGFYLPERIDATLACRALPLQLIQPWLPDEFIIQGDLGCDIRGSWYGDGSFAGVGATAITAGTLFWHDGVQDIEIALDQARLGLDWQDSSLRGQVAVEHDYGHIHSTVEIGLLPRFPVTLAETIPVSGAIELLLRESGLLSVFFPQHIYDSRGRVDLTAAVAGTVGEPTFSGSFSVDEAEMFLPAAGIRLYDMGLEAHLQDQQFEISNLSVRSGEGAIAGRGRVEIQGWIPETYQFVLEGDQFRLVNLTELTAHVSPNLVIDGSRENVQVRGDILFPRIMVKDLVSAQVTQNSPDLIIVDRQVPERTVPRISHDIDVNLLLGDQVLLDVAGLEALVGGSLRLYSDPQQQFAAQGRLFIVRGRYSTYGVTLDIERGELYYAGVPLPYPTLDILALRRAGQVRAGVRVSGTPQEPLVSLYSEPSMPDADVLSYMLLGRPLDSSGGDTDLLMVAAGALLSQGESIVLQERLKGRLGLDVLEFSAGEGDITDSVITTGKYITPDLYVSLGYSLFNQTNEIRIRYRLTNRMDLESSFGQESGVDLFYRFERE